MDVVIGLLLSAANWLLCIVKLMADTNVRYIIQQFKLIAWQPEVDGLNSLLLNQPTRDDMNDFDQVLENWDFFLDDTEDFDDVKIVEED